MTAENVYDVGDEVQLTATFKVGETPTNPTTVVMKVKKPDGTLVDHSTELIHVGPGVWYVDITTTQSGFWSYRYEGTGTVIAAGEGEFYVRKKKVV